MTRLRDYEAAGAAMEAGESLEAMVTTSIRPFFAMAGQLGWLAICWIFIRKLANTNLKKRRYDMIIRFLSSGH